MHFEEPKSKCRLRSLQTFLNINEKIIKEFFLYTNICMGYDSKVGYIRSCIKAIVYSQNYSRKMFRNCVLKKMYEFRNNLLNVVKF